MIEIEKKKQLVPALRFKEFKGEWTLGEIEQYLKLYVERVPANTELPVLTSSRTGLYKQSDYFNNRKVANKGDYGVVPRGYFTYRHMSDDSTFKFNINNLCDKGAVSKEYPVFTTVGMDSMFLYNKLNHGNELKRFAIEQKLGGTRVRLYFKKLKHLKIPIPTLPEQQKIAAFLSTVDQKIQQLCRKKELLEQYKKGVMQQLFSGQLRFKDEQGKDYPDWEEKHLGDLGSFKGGGTPTTNIEKYWNGNIPWVSSSDLTENDIHNIRISRFISENALSTFATKLIPKNSLLFVSRVGVGKLAVNEKALCTSQDFANFTPTSSISFYIGYYFLAKNNLLKRYSQGTSIKGFTSSDLKSIKLQCPSLEEQQKTANFLSSIDTKIESVNQQITQTQTFKKGLLQQLFV